MIQLQKLFHLFKGTLRKKKKNKKEMEFKLPTVFLFLASLITVATAFDPYDPIGNITLRWDVMNWTPDGYVAVINITNSQRYRTVQNPGWKLGWTWAGREIIWTAVGAEATHQGDCSRFKGNIPHSCSKTPNIIDVPPNTPYNQQVYGCCRSGILLSRYQDLYKSTAEFQIAVGMAGSTNRTVRMPKNFTLEAGASGRSLGGYTCGPAKIVRNTRFVTADGRRVTQALMTWKVVCTYSSFKANKRPTCCVSVSSADQKVKATCPTCSCSCRNQTICNGIVAPAVMCTDHMCPTSIHWQMLPKNKNGEMGARVSITNFDNKFNYTDWTMFVNHPSINHLTTFLDANHRRVPSSTMNVVWGIKNKNRVINTSGAKGSTVSWVMHFKGVSHKNYTANGCNKNWCAPKAVLFNGDQCVLPLEPKLN